MAIYTNDRYRIKRNAEQEKMMRKLIENKIFSSYSEILSISAVIGYNNKMFVPVSKAAADGVLMQFFNEEEKDLMDILAYCHKKHQSILRDDEKYEVYEAYANGGFPILLSKLEIVDQEDALDRKRIITQYFSLLVTNGFSLTDSKYGHDILIGVS